MPNQVTDHDIMQAALLGLQTQLNQTNEKMASIRAQLGQRGQGRPAAASDGLGEIAPKRRITSAAARKRIGEATQKRWAAFRAAKGKAETAAAKPKRKMSAEGRARIIAATKKRWAAVHKAQRAAT